MDDDLIQLRVADVKVAVPAGNGVEAGLVVLEEEVYPYRTLRMFIGQPEARAIHVPWSNTIPPRPSTWDLFVSTIAILDGRIERVVITDVEELRHYFAQIAIVQNEDEEPILITARPSDALALALRSYGAKIYVHPHVLDEAGVLADGTRWVPPEPEPVAADPEAETSTEPEAETLPEAETRPEVAAEPEAAAEPAAEPEAAAAPPAEPEGAPSDTAPVDPEPVTWPSGVEEIGPASSQPAAAPPVVDEAQETTVPVAEANRAVVEPAPVEPAAGPRPAPVEPIPAPGAESAPEPPTPSPDVAFPAAGPAEPAAKKVKGKDKKAKSDADRKKVKKKRKLAEKKSGRKDGE